MRFRPLYLLLAAAVGTAVAASGAARVIQGTALRSEPFADAATVAQVAADAQVSVIERKGGWYKVNAGASEGWLRMTAVRLGTGGGEGGDSGLGQTLQFLTTGRSGSSGVTAATGIKGWDEQNVLHATPNHRALEELDRLAADSREARDFAAKGRLSAHQVAYPAGSASRGTTTAPSMPQKEGAF